MTCPPLGITARASVVGVVDGDTLDIELRVPLRVRLLDCWAPESRTKDEAEKKLGLAAKASMTRLTEKRLGQVFIPTFGAHSAKDVLTMDRVLAKVWMDGDEVDLSAAQVAGGYASTTKGGVLGQ